MWKVTQECQIYLSSAEDMLKMMQKEHKYEVLQNLKTGNIKDVYGKIAV